MGRRTGRCGHNSVETTAHGCSAVPAAARAARHERKRFNASADEWDALELAMACREMTRVLDSTRQTTRNLVNENMALLTQLLEGPGQASEELAAAATAELEAMREMVHFVNRPTEEIIRGMLLLQVEGGAAVVAEQPRQEIQAVRELARVDDRPLAAILAEMPLRVEDVDAAAAAAAGRQRDPQEPADRQTLAASGRLEAQEPTPASGGAGAGA